ncbi:hypothetical protein [Streptomyces chryseus]
MRGPARRRPRRTVRQRGAGRATRYEAETAPAVCTGAIDSDGAGYSGSGFCNADNAVSAYAQFTLNAPTAGTATLKVRFADGTSTARPANVTVNGSAATPASFEGTGAWGTWGTKTLTVPVRSGSNTLRISPTTSAGLPDIDPLEAEVGGSIPPPSGSALYVVPNGSESAAGTESAPTTLTSAINRVTPGGTILLRGGVYGDGSQAGNGDRNGYKLGGEDIGVDHVVRRGIAYDNGKHGFTYHRNPGTMSLSDNVSIDNAERDFSFDAGTSVFRGNVSCRGASGSNDKVVGNADSSNQFWSGSNGPRCSSYGGALRWSFAAGGRLVASFGSGATAALDD